MEKLTRTINLTRGLTAIVDADDYEELNKYKWCASWSGCGWRAARATIIGKIKSSRSSLRKTRMIYMHRQIMNFPDSQIDHINGNSLDNRKCNLRNCTKTQNAQNAKCDRKNNSSGAKGVYWHFLAKKWLAQITVNKKWVYIGMFSNFKNAVLAYNCLARYYFGEFTRGNK